ncbi:MAG: radical SAM protein [Erysipelotrichaceae bacterium]|nr:radical SAM protein [Erysipelotrichaceae bacterium]
MFRKSIDKGWIDIMEQMNDATTVERMLIKRAENNKIPINGSIELLPLCNMNCDMCYVRLSQSEMESQGRLRTVDEWISIAHEMKDAGTLFLLLTGGEPLLYPGFKELYLALKELGMVITINTNGTLIDEEWAQFFGKHKPRRINITLYGSNNDTYYQLCHYLNGYDKATNGIKLLKKYHVDVKISSSITKANKDEIRDMIHLGDELDIPVRCDTYMMPAVRERSRPYDKQSRLSPSDAAKARVIALKHEMKDELFKEYIHQSIYEIEHILPCNEENHMKCHAGKCSFTINWQGQMRPCVIMSYPRIDVFENGFMNSWKYVVEETSKIVLSNKCNTCNLRTICRTCAASALLEEGSYNKEPKYMCEYSEYTYKYLRKEYMEIRNEEE